MTTEFLSGDIWRQLTKAVRASRQRCSVAVAYFGAGASNLLPLPKGSRLVVDASERAVASGQTCPAELQKLLSRGVEIYSVPNLHAKVFVVGRVAYIGSTNVSNRSAVHLVEAAIRTTDRDAVRTAREFVSDHCLHQLTPKLLKQLAKLYRPPIVPGGKRRQKAPKELSDRPTLPRLLFAPLKLEHWSEREQGLHDAALPVAKRRRRHPRSYEMDQFVWTGQCPYSRHDVVLQVTDEGNGNVLMAPPGNVIHVQTRRYSNQQVSIVFVERPSRRRRSIKSLARTLSCTQKQLRQYGLIRNRFLSEGLLKVWAVTR